MSTINITDMSTYIRSFLSNLIKTSFPDIDTSENSTFDDLYIKPSIEAIQPLIESTNTVDIMRDLSNASAMEDDDLNSIGENNYGLKRNTGDKASTSLIISYSKIPDSDNTIIPSGSIFTTSSGLEYLTTQKYSFTISEMEANYNTSTLLYEAYVDLTAAATGSEYNVSANQITGYPTTLSSYIDNVKNPTTVTNGSDAETNDEYAARLNTYFVSRYVGTVPGYKADALALVASLSDIKVIGKDDAEMTRDLITVLINSVQTQIHIGGKTDIYVKGSSYIQTSLSMNVYSGHLLLSTEYASINQSTIAVTNTTTPAKTVTWAIVQDSTKAYINITNTAGASYSITDTDIISVAYSTNATTPVSITDTFTCGLSQAEFEIPFNSVISVINSASTAETFTEGSDYNIIHKDIDGNVITSASVLYGSTKERTYIQFIDGSTILNGLNALVTYTVNDSISTLYDHYEADEQRSTTVDLLIKEAGKKYVNIQFAIMMKDMYTLDDEKKVRIQTIVTEFIDSLLIGDIIKESDIVNAVYSDTTIMTYLSYIKLPFISFYVPTNITDSMTATHNAESYISPGTTEYIKLNKFAVIGVA